ncbi:MAG: hypothetical protein AB1640_13755 [bacterium]
MRKSASDDVRGRPCVEVRDEPMHRHLFENERFRVYCATIPPGGRTLYHRHSEDTLYVALEGGVSCSRTIGPRYGTRYRFPRSFGSFAKAWFGVRGLLLGSAHVPKRSFFLMLNRGFPVAHRVSASRRNAKDMKLLGIEILERGGADRGSRAGFPPSVKMEYESKDFAVLSVRVEPGSATRTVRFDGPGMVVSMSDRLTFTAPDEGGQLCARLELKAGEFLPCEPGKFVVLSAPGPEPLAALLIARH